MSQNDFTIANQTFPNTRADINSALQALASTSSGSSEPSTTFANQLFYNTTSNLLQIRNEDNDAFITIAELDQSNDTVEYVKSDSIRTALIEFTDGDDALAIADGGALTVSTSLDMNGTELFLDADADTSITADTDDRVDFRVGGADVAHITKNDIGGIINRRNAQPIIINGNMAVAQRGTSFPSSPTGEYTLDRFESNGFNLSTGVYRVDQSTNTPTGQGFANSVKVYCTTADASQDANNQIYFQTQLEGYSTNLLHYYAPSPSTVTIAFWVRSNRTGSFSFALKLSDNGSAENSTDTRIYHQTYSISSANTWEKQVFAITLDSSTGQTKVTDNRFAVALQFWLGAGSSRRGASAGAWEDNGNATTLSDNLDLTGSTANDWFITGLQMEVGEYDSTTIPPFQHETFVENKTRCQRYFIGDSELVPTAQATSATAIQGLPQFRTEMRASPTATHVATAGFGLVGGSFTTTSLAVSNIGVNGGRFAVNHNSSISTLQLVQCGLPVTLDAEL